jgi:outer membrane beta-barrel protein
VRALKLFFLTSCFVISASADLYDLPAAEAVMNRKFQYSNQMSFYGGYLPLTSFSKYLTFGGSYLKKIDQYSGWELINAMGASEMPTELKQELIRSYGVTDSDLYVLNAVVTTNYIYSPFYMKTIFFNSELVRSQLSLIGGGGFAQFARGSLPAVTVPTIDVGLSIKFFKASMNSIDLDIRHYIFFVSNPAVRSNVMVSLSYSIPLGGQN